MKKYLHKPSLSKYLLVLGLLVTASIIHSCKKDYSKTDPKLDQATAQAKSWYEATYPASSGTSGNLVTQSADEGFNAGQRIKPDWQHSKKYKRGNKDVIELPIDPATKFNSALRDKATNRIPYDKNNSRSYFLLFNDGKKYSAYIMTVIADASYVKGDTSKIKNNTFSHNDPDFTGLVLYFTPKGKYVQGYAYKNGQLVVPSASGHTTQTTQSVADPNLKPQTMITVCIDWYYQTWTDGVLTSERYLFTTCDTYGDGDDGGSGGTTPPPGCGPPIIEDAVSGNHLIVNSTLRVNFIPPPDDPCDEDPTHSKWADFGEDDPSDCLNCRITPENFGDFLDYVRGQGYTVTSSANELVGVNGVDYNGTVTEIRNSSGQLVASYFTPSQDQGSLYAGVSYTFGNKGPDGTQNQASSPPAIFGSAASNIGTATVTYQPISSGTTPANTTVIDFEGNRNMSNTDPDIAWWNDNTTTFPHQTLPTYANMYANYPKDGWGRDLPGPQVYQAVGGAVLAAYNSNPAAYQNACALRVSKALNYSGNPIPVVSGQTYKGADNKNYFLSSSKLYNYIKKTFGAPTIHLTQTDGGVNGQNFNSHLVGHKGIYIMQAASPALFLALGHCTLYDGSDCIGGHNFFNAKGGVTSISLWVLN